MRYFVICIALLSLFGCAQKNENTLNIGLIKPSLNHLPLQYALHKNQGQFRAFKLHYFSSGWEVNEALVNEKVDLAILPFTYIWNDVSQGRKVKIISFLERESDGIIAQKEISDIYSLKNRRLGVLKNSTLEIIPRLVFSENNIELPELVFFRTPMDMAAALNSGNVDALCYYVPSIYKFPADFKIIYWLSEEFPAHTCCDIAATEKAIKDKDDLICQLLSLLNATLSNFTAADEELVRFASDYYQLPEELIVKSLAHTKYITGLQSSSALFEEKAARIMFEQGYINKTVVPSEVYYNINP